MEETIAAIATPFGVGGVGVIRISGREARGIAEQVFVPCGKRKISTVKGFRAIYGKVKDQEGIFDEAVATVFLAPRSYTGEDVVELSCHGGIYLLQRLLHACIAAGAFPAQPGEFTKRAFLHGKLGLEQAEAVMDLIDAKSKLSASAALQVKDGVLSRGIEKIAGELTTLSAALSAWADYPEEDLEELEPQAMLATLQQSHKALQQLSESYAMGQILTQGIATVIIGKPNVGKSTLMNLLCGRNASIVTPIAGTTRDVVEQTVTVGEMVLRIADTAGIHDTSDPVEQLGIAAAQNRIDSSTLILAVFDGSQPLDAQDEAIMALAEQHTAIAMLNKADCPLRADRFRLEQCFAHVLPISARENTGISQLSDAIAQQYHVKQLDANQPILYTERQQLCVKQAWELVGEALESLEGQMTLDAVHICLDSALERLYSLTGKTASEEIVHQVFSRFCVGK